jgi:hypothetical protein
MTILIACISKSSLDYENTLSTLIYCEKASNITKVQKQNVKIAKIYLPKKTSKDVVAFSRTSSLNNSKNAKKQSYASGGREASSIAKKFFKTYYKSVYDKNRNSSMILHQNHSGNKHTTINANDSRSKSRASKTGNTLIN